MPRPGGRIAYALRLCALVLGLTAGGVADACTLDALLRLPLERLLQLTIGAQPGQQAGHPCATGSGRRGER